MVRWGRIGGAVMWAMAAFWLVKCGYAMYSVYRRMQVEDIELRKQFGHVWDNYRRNVPYTMVPWVI